MDIKSCNNKCFDSSTDDYGGTIDNYTAEALETAGAPVNVFKLLGIHEQGELVDLTGSGTSLASGSAAGSLPQYAFNDNTDQWISSATGDAVAGTTYIGYNFGTLKTTSGNEQYQPPAPIRKHITTIRIKQGGTTANHAIQVRIERSDDGGASWKRVDVVNVPDSNNIETLYLRQSAPSQMWRIVPILFNGDSTDPWVVEELELMDYNATSIDNIQDLLFMENRDRDYAKQSVQLKAQYDLIDVQTELTKFGIDIPQQFIFTVSFSRMVELIGRPVVIGDIIELPSEAQYDHNMNKVKKWLEVTDTTWSTEGYTPTWKPLLYRITAQPLLASQETRDVTGLPHDWEQLSDDDFLLGSLANEGAYQSSENLEKSALEASPETGTDPSGLEEVVIDPSSNEVVSEVSYGDIYTRDGIPPNDNPYTTGTRFPDGPNDGDYHRLEYDPALNIPTKLYQFNAVKHKWIFIETDERTIKSSFRPNVQAIMDSTTKQDLDK